jgi:hypothetical protein
MDDVTKLKVILDRGIAETGSELGLLMKKKGCCLSPKVVADMLAMLNEMN